MERVKDGSCLSVVLDRVERCESMYLSLDFGGSTLLKRAAEAAEVDLDDDVRDVADIDDDDDDDDVGATCCCCCCCDRELR